MTYDVRAEFGVAFEDVTSERIDRLYDVLALGGLSSVALIFSPLEGRVVMIAQTGNLGCLTLFTHYWFRVFGGFIALKDASFTLQTPETEEDSDESRELADARAGS